jgi:hypothetical protein
MHADAAFSTCRRYRFALWRRWDDGPRVLFVLLNPSTADESTDDPTVRRCTGFARNWGFGSMTIANLFALRSSSPAALFASADPVGPGNDDWLIRLRDESSLTVAGWGNRGRLLGRSTVVKRIFPRLQVLGLTVFGEPRHPLYVRSDVLPRPWPKVTREALT